MSHGLRPVNYIRIAHHLPACRFGICHVDFKTLERTPKKSANWLSGHFFKLSALGYAK